MKVAVLGSGNICGNLRRLLGRAGHEVLFASRHSEDLTMLVAQAGPRAMAGGIDDAFAFSDVVAEALPYAAVLHLSADKLACKILISSLMPCGPAVCLKSRAPSKGRLKRGDNR